MNSKYLPLLALALGMGTLPTSARHRSFGDGLPGYLEQYDVNADGMIDEEERQAIKAAREAARAALIAEWDADGDGVLSDTEKEALREAIRAEIEAKRIERFNELAGEDGLLSLEEFAAIPGIDELSAERVAALYTRMDADGSGAVTVDEFNSRLRHHRDGHDDDGDDEHKHGLTDEERAAAEAARRQAAFGALAGESAEDGTPATISAEEFAAAYPNLDATRRDEVFAAADADGSGDLTIDEFTYDYRDLAEDDEDAARQAVREAAAQAKRQAAFDALAGEPAEDGTPATISAEEFAAAYPNLDATRRDEVFAAADADGSGDLTIDEFSYDYKDLAEDDKDAARRAAREAAAEAKRVEAFDALAGDPGEDGTSSISLEEFLAAQPDGDPVVLEAAFVAMDANGDGVVTLDEFTYDADGDDRHHGEDDDDDHDDDDDDDDDDDHDDDDDDHDDDDR